MNNHRDAGRSMFVGSVRGLANVGAAIATFLASPEAYDLTVDWVRAYIANHYGPGWRDVVEIVWFGLVVLLCFFLARASLSTLLVMGGLALATRLF